MILSPVAASIRRRLFALGAILLGFLLGHLLEPVHVRLLNRRHGLVEALPLCVLHGGGNLPLPVRRPDEEDPLAPRGAVEDHLRGRPLAALRKAAQGTALEANAAREHGLVTFAYDDVDWEDEVRMFVEERASFSPDAMTGMEANLRFAGPETMETRIFGRLTAWQNWIFQRPNAAGEEGALQRYGTGVRGKYNMERV